MPCLIRTRSGIYYLVSSVNGKRVWRSTRTRVRTVAYQQYLLASNVVSADAPGRPPETISEAIQHYLALVRVQLAPKTCEVYKHTLAHLRAFVDGHRLVSTLTTWEIDQYKIHRSRLVKPSTVNIELRSLKSFFNTLKRWEMIHKDPCEGVALVRFPEQPPRYLPKDEIPVLIDAIQEQWLKDIVLFALMSGARLGEILNLRWEDVDLPNRTARIQSRHAYRVKGGKVRTVPLNVTLTEILSSRATREGIVFTGKRGKQVDSNYVSQKFREIVRSLGFDRGIHFHSLRHTFASLLVKSGVSLYKVQKLLGHSSSRVTEMYAYLQPSEMHDVVSLLSI